MLVRIAWLIVLEGGAELGAGVVVGVSENVDALLLVMKNWGE